MASQTYVDSVTLTAATEFNRFDTAAYPVLGSVAGTNTITAAGPANLTLVATNPVLWFIPANTNTGATTLNITPSGGSALGAKNVFCGGVACVGGEIVAGVPCAVVYDGTQYQLIKPRVGVVAIVSSTNLPSANSVTIQDIPQIYSALILSINGARSSTTTRAVQVTASIDNGSSATNTVDGNFIQNTTAFADSNSTLLLATSTQTSSQVTSATIVLTGYQAGPFCKVEAAGKYADSTAITGNYQIRTASAINALTIILNDTGNFDAGTYALYGVL